MFLVSNIQILEKPCITIRNVQYQSVIQPRTSAGINAPAVSDNAASMRRRRRRVRSEETQRRADAAAKERAREEEEEEELR